MKKSKELDYLSNRDRKRQPKKDKGWCICDRDIVPIHGKCRNCGRTYISKRNKK